MPPKTKRQKHSSEAAKLSHRHIAEFNEEETEQPKDLRHKIDPDYMVTCGLLLGTGYQQLRKECLLFNQKPPSEATFYRHQPGVLEKVHQTVSEQVDGFAANIQDGARLSGDACWNHVRNGSHSTSSIFDNDQKKIVAFQNVTKNDCNASNMMETFGMRKNFEHLEPFLKNRDITFTHDHDNKTGKLLREYNFTENLDPGHAIKEIRRKANNFFDDCAKERLKTAINDSDKSEETKSKLLQQKRGRKPVGLSLGNFKNKYNMMIEKLITWFNFLVYNIEDIDQRTAMWTNSANHFIGDHSQCIHPDSVRAGMKGRPRKHVEEFWVWEEAVNDETFVHELVDFLESTTPLLQKVGHATTQDLESLHANIGRTRPKSQHFASSNSARVEIAIGRKNDPHFDTKLLRSISSESLSSDSFDELYEDEERNIRRASFRSSIEEKRKKNKMRKLSRKKNKTTPGDYKDKGGDA